MLNILHVKKSEFMVMDHMKLILFAIAVIVKSLGYFIMPLN